MSSGMAVFICCCALLLGMLLNADALLAGAEQKPFGAERTSWLRVWRPVHFISHALLLDRPRGWLDDSLGRSKPAGSFLDTVEAPAANEPSAPVGPPRLRTPDLDHPLRLWVGGDSMAQVFGQSLVGIGDGTGFVSSELDYKISTGLSRPDVFDWPRELADIVTRPDGPEVLVIVFGANDSQGLRSPDGSIFQPESEGWRIEYRRRVAATMDIVRGPGRLIVWLGQPVMRDDGFSRRLMEINTIFREEAATRPGILFFDSWELFADSSGRYSPFIRDEAGNEEDMRQADGIHLTRAGGDRLATAVLKQIAAVAQADFGLR
jgi:hypothetical protein